VQMATIASQLARRLQDLLTVEGSGWNLEYFSCLHLEVSERSSVAIHFSHRPSPPLHRTRDSSVSSRVTVRDFTADRQMSTSPQCQRQRRSRHRPSGLQQNQDSEASKR
jgi:hypothetical protein